MEIFLCGIGWVTGGGFGWGSQGGACHFVPSDLPRLSRQDVFPEPNQRFGRLSDYAKLGLAGVTFALRDAGLEKWTEKRDIPVIAATRLGCLATDLDYHTTLVREGGEFVSPNLFAYTLANCFLGDAAIQLGLSGSSIVINETRGGLDAVTMAWEDIATGEAETALAGICDLAVPGPFGGTVGVAPGALFLVLSGAPAVANNYGAVTLADDGSILYNRSSIAGIVELARAALSRRGKQTESV